MEISAALVKQLRDRTGLSMMECKKALAENGGDMDKAIDYLRKRGLAKASEMASREATQGRIACFVDEAAGRAGMVELRCETAPVAATDDFIKLADLLARHAAQTDNPTADAIFAQQALDGSGRSVKDIFDAAFNRLRENLQVARIASARGSIGHYLHHNAQVGVLVEMSTDCDAEAKRGVCMHVAFARPPYIRRDEVDPTRVEQERALAREQVKDKPANIIDKIVEGKLNTWFAEVCLLDQGYVKEDGKRSVQAYLSSVKPGLTINRCIRFEVGGS
ncbi:MAG: translation elongation factor Ts [Phycisphaerae bacterium]